MHIAAVRATSNALAPLSLPGRYVNFITDIDTDRCGQLRRGDLRPAGSAQTPIRPGKPVPPQPERAARAMTP